MVEVAPCGPKMAETMVALRRSVALVKSDHSNAPFRTPDPQAMAMAKANFGIG